MLINYIFGTLAIFTQQPPNLEQDEAYCSNFYNELWICNSDQKYNASDPYHALNEVATAALVMPVNMTHDKIFQLQRWLHEWMIPIPAAYRQQRLSPLYVIDSMIDFTHSEFEGLHTRSVSFNRGSLLNMHGTHVASIAAGKTLGSSNRLLSELVGLHVIDDENQAPWSAVINALEWCSRNAPGIINLSIAGPRNRAVNLAVETLIKHGHRVVTASGNNGADGCDYSPGSADGVINVGSLQFDPPKTAQSSFSNAGKCVTMYAKGEGVLGAVPGNHLAYWTGTSMAAPQVAGLWSGQYFMDKSRFLKQYSRLNPDYNGRRDLAKP